MDFSRREFSLASVASTSGRGGGAPVFDGEALQRDLQTYARHASQETGSVGNIEVSDWVARRLAAAGLEVEALPVAVPYFNAAQVSIQVGARGFEGWAQAPVCTTLEGGVRAPLSVWFAGSATTPVQGKILVAWLPHGRHSSILAPSISAPIRHAIEQGAAGLVLVTDGPTGEAIALNAPIEHGLASLPTIVLGSNAARELMGEAWLEREAVLTIRGDTGVRTGRNVIGVQRGQGPWLVVTTPLSGWFACAAERGAGVSTFLAWASAFSRRFSSANMMFAGLVGHERENIGGKSFLERRAPPATQVGLWVHLGANLAARDWHETASGLLPLPSADAQRYLLAHPDCIALLAERLRGHPGLENPYPATVANAAGEAREILAHGYTRLIANFGGHRMHHTRRDTLDCVSGEIVAPVATDLCAAIVEAARRNAVRLS